MEHGPCVPVKPGPVRACPTCRNIAYRVIADKKFGRTYAPDSPTHCGNRHPLGPRRVHLGYSTCTPHDGHNSWRCNTCGDEMWWPPQVEGCATYQHPTPVEIEQP